MRSFDHRPLLGGKSNQQLLTRKTCIGKPRCVQALKLPETTEREHTSNDWNDEERCPTCHQSSNHEIMTQNMINSFAAGSQPFELAHYSQPAGFTSEGDKFDELFIEVGKRHAF